MVSCAHEETSLHTTLCLLESMDEDLPTIARVLFEVLKNSTSAVYQWNHQSVTDVHTTIDKAANFLFETENVPSGSRVTFTLWFIRHLIYEDSINEFVPKQMSGPSYITFHKFR